MKKTIAILGAVAALAFSGTAFAGNYGGQYNDSAAYLHMFEGSPNSVSCYQNEPRCKAPKVKKCKPRCAPKPPKVTKCKPRSCKPKPPVYVNPCGETRCGIYGYPGSSKRYDRAGRRIS